MAPKLLLLMPEALVKPGTTERRRDRRDGETGRRGDNNLSVSPPLPLLIFPSFYLSVSSSLHLSVSLSLRLSVPLSLRLLRWRARTRCGRARAFVNSPHAPTSR